MSTPNYTKGMLAFVRPGHIIQILGKECEIFPGHTNDTVIITTTDCLGSAAWKANRDRTKKYNEFLTHVRFQRKSRFQPGYINVAMATLEEFEANWDNLFLG